MLNSILLQEVMCLHRMCTMILVVIYLTGSRHQFGFAKFDQISVSVIIPVSRILQKSSRQKCFVEQI